MIRTLKVIALIGTINSTLCTLYEMLAVFIAIHDCDGLELSITVEVFIRKSIEIGIMA